MKKQKKKDKSYLLALALLLLAGFFVFLFLLPEGQKPNSAIETAQSKQFEDRVNRHLFKTSQTIEMEREKMKIEAENLANLGIGPKAAAPDDVQNLDLSTDARAAELLQALGREAKESGGPFNPDEQVQADLFQSQQFQEYSEEYKKEYARQFVENARKAGYQIRLNDDYKVISIRQIRKPAENFELFQSQGPAVR